MKENYGVREIMEDFARQTGLQEAGEAGPHRYLWTDAFGVCNYLALYRQSGMKADRDMALKLVDQVHETLGRHRPDDARSGWISGLAGEDGRLHPTAGGLRIGKKLPERGPDEPFDEGREWDRDGQYYHYLTKWMHALCRVTRTLGRPVCTSWAQELAVRAHRGFCYPAGDAKRLYWKMSIDLSRPQVSAMGHHDPLDGLITGLEIRELAGGKPEIDTEELDAAINDLAGMCRGVNWITHDPLGLGGLLADAWRLAQLMGRSPELLPPGLLEEMLDAAMVGLSIYMRDNSLHLPAARRLAFRELGLAIGLQAIDRIEALAASVPEFFSGEPRLESLLKALHHYLRLHPLIEQFWLASSSRKAPSWTEHAEINMVMLATCLAPEGYLDR